MIYNKEMIQPVAEYVTGLFISNQPKNLVYHNLAHTITVVERAEEIATNYLLSDQDYFILLSAAWFHDCGHLFVPAKGHEKKSVQEMKTYMENVNADKEIVSRIEECIASTKFPTNPQSLLAAILCDADLYHLGTDEFRVTDQLIKKELELQKSELLQHWNINTLAMLEKHQYFTEYCRILLSKGKLENIARVKDWIAGGK